MRLTDGRIDVETVQQGVEFGIKWQYRIGGLIDITFELSDITLEVLLISL